VSRTAGATVFAVLLTRPTTPSELETLAGLLGPAGADRVLLCEDRCFDAPALDATHGRALLAVAERVSPLLVLFPAGGPGAELGPSLAARIAGAYTCAADVIISDYPGALPDSVGRVQLLRWRADRSAYRRLDPVEIERPVIVTLGAHSAPEVFGTNEVEVELVTCPPPATEAVVELESAPDDAADVPLARGLVVVAAGQGELAAALRAAAPEGVAVVDAGEVSPAALAMSSPEWLLAVGAIPAGVRPSPRTRIGLVISKDSSLPDQAAMADVIWQPAGAATGRDDLQDQLVAALSQTLTPPGEEQVGR
jgi:hypothetical protein